MAERKCKLCERKTNIVFNVNLRVVYICQKCATKIARQELEDMFERLQDSTKES